MVKCLEADALEPYTYPRILFSFKGEGEGLLLKGLRLFKLPLINGLSLNPLTAGV